MIQNTFSLLSAFNELEREGVQTYPPEDQGTKITVLGVAMYGSYPAYQKGSAKFTLQPADLQQGENKIAFRHEVELGVEEYEALKYLFYDNGPTPPVVPLNPTLAIQTLNSAKYLSGVRFYSIGDVFTIGFQIDEAFDNTYSLNVAKILDDGLGIGSEEMPYTASDEGYNGSINIPVVTEPYTIAALLRTIDVVNKFKEGARIGVRGQDPWNNSAYKYSATSPLKLVNTYSPNSTALVENFRDEVYRLPDGAHDTVPSPISGVWDPTAVLPSPAAQVWGNTLVYPTKNFSTGYEPVGPDYSGRTGDQPYVRAFYQALASKGQGILKIPPLITSDLSSNVKVEVKLPTQTGWMDLGVAYDPQTFDGSAGQGCLFSSSGDEFTWSCGGFRTLNSGNLIMVRVSMKTAVKALTGLSEVGW